MAEKISRIGDKKGKDKYGSYINCAATCNVRCNTSEICSCPFIERKYPDHHLEIKSFLMEIRDYDKVRNATSRLTSADIKLWLIKRGKNMK